MYFPLIGDNSFGKTSLLKSFKWVLYGDTEGTETKSLKYEKAIKILKKGICSEIKKDYLFYNYEHELKEIERMSKHLHEK